MESTEVLGNVVQNVNGGWDGQPELVSEGEVVLPTLCPGMELHPSGKEP